MMAETIVKILSARSIHSRFETSHIRMANWDFLELLILSTGLERFSSVSDTPGKPRRSDSWQRFDPKHSFGATSISGSYAGCDALGTGDGVISRDIHQQPTSFGRIECQRDGHVSGRL